MMCNNPECCSLNLKRNGKRKTNGKWVYQQYVCKDCGKHFSKRLDSSRLRNLTYSLKPRVAMAIALYAVGLSREKIEQKTRVSSETILRNLTRFVDYDKWGQLESFITLHFRTVRMSEMQDLKRYIFCFQDGLISLRERAQEATLQMKIRTKKEQGKWHRRVSLILAAGDRNRV